MGILGYFLIFAVRKNSEMNELVRYILNSVFPIARIWMVFL